jgi:hypoxanthine-guanine phosphoribosyltransferase
MKPANFHHEEQVHYVGLEIPGDFIIGYGLDYNGYGRNLLDIYKIID